MTRFLLVVLAVACVCDVSALRIRHMHRDGISTSATATILSEGFLRETASLTQTQRSDIFQDALSQQLLETLGQTETQNPANGQVGVEVEYQGSPRVVIRSTVALPVSHTNCEIVPLLYGDAWSRAGNLFYLSNDNEQDQPAGPLLTAWAPIVQASYAGLPTLGAATALLQSSTVGKHSAIELVTSPVDTDVQADQLLMQTAMRKFAETISEARRAVAPFDAVAQTGDLAAAKFTPALGGAGRRCYTYELIRTTYNAKVAVPLLNTEFPGISGYTLAAAVLPPHARLANQQIIDGGQVAGAGYQYYLCFPTGANTVYAAQVNFGYPLANFGSSDAAKMLTTATGAGVDYNLGMGLRSHTYKFTGFVLAHIQAQGVILGNAIGATAGAAINPIVLSAAELGDVRGFITAVLYHYFHKAYFGATTKGIHNVLIKTPLNDLLRYLSANCKLVISRWALSRGLPGIQTDLLAASVNVYTAARLGTFFGVPAGPGGNRGYTPLSTVPGRLAMQNAMVANIFGFSPAGARWNGETVNTYGTLDTTVAVYPNNPATGNPRYAESAAGKTVAPFQIRGRVSVLVESRMGGTALNRGWRDVRAWSVARRAEFIARLAEMAALQTTLIETQQQQQEQQEQSNLGRLYSATESLIRGWGDEEKDKNGKVILQPVKTDISELQALVKAAEEAAKVKNDRVEEPETGNDIDIDYTASKDGKNPDKEDIDDPEWYKPEKKL